MKNNLIADREEKKDAMADHTYATFNYFKWQPLFEEEKPFEILMNLPDDAVDQRQVNFSFEPSKSLHPVRSARSREREFQLNVHGFAFRKHTTDFTDWRDREAVEREYIPAMERFLKDNIEDAERVITYNWRLRNSEKQLPKTINLLDPTAPLQVATQPHVDCSVSGGIAMLKHHHPNDAEILLGRRFRIINIWRPISEVRNWPLAICDGRTVEPSDLVMADRVRRDFVSESVWSMENDQHKWYYLPEQKTDEVTLVKIVDTSTDVESNYGLHAAFNVGGDQADQGRESIEMRVFVFS